DFTASIDWGDGTVGAGAVTGGGGTFVVSGMHTYANSGQDTITVTLTEDSPGTATATAFTTVNIGAQFSGQVTLASATEGVALNNATIATFTDTNHGDTAGTFLATINWGDGTSSAGTVTGANGTFAVAGSHTYADEATGAALSVTITDTANN